jgi:arylsulfatase A-like enzyme/Flp pilus assembly protein TadD
MAHLSWSAMARRPLILVAALAALAAALGAVALRRRAAARPAAGASVLLVTFDTLRADRFDAARMPALHALGQEGLVFEEALSSVPLTLPSHSTILSGLEPLHHGVRDNGGAGFPADVPTLATLLESRGYATGAFVGAYVLDRRFGLARGFDHYDDRIERRAEGTSVLESERRAEAVVGPASEWVAAQSGPFLAWVHLYDPHAPYDPPSPYREGYAGRLYDGEVAYADHWLGRLLEAARSRAGGNLLVAVLADHGEGLGEHGERTHGLFVYQSTLRVPLVLAGPGIPRGERRAGPARTVDVLPTLLGRLGVPAPPGDGVDLIAAAGARSAYAETLYPETFGWCGLRAYRDRTLKLIEAPRTELYDLAADPGESSNLAASRPADVDRLQRALTAARQGERRAAAGPADPQVAERLRALGYAGGGGPVAPAAGPRPDPKDALPLWQGFEAAMDAQGQGRAAEALALLRGLVARDPGNGTFRRNLASALRRQGQGAEAARTLGELVEEAPGDPHAWHERSVALAALGKVDQAVQAEDRALELDPGLAEAHNHRGILEARRGRPAEALRSFEAAGQVDPNNAHAWSNRGNALRVLGRLGEAEASYRRAAELAPGDPDPVNGLGVLAVQRGDLEGAATLFAQALERDPAYADARRGDVGAARRRLRQLLGASPPPDVAARARRLLTDLGP